MDDRVFFVSTGLVAALMIGFALIWPQGLGLPSPAPFGHKIEIPDVERYKVERAKRDADRAAQKAAAPKNRDVIAAEKAKSGPAQ